MKKFGKDSDITKNCGYDVVSKMIMALGVSRQYASSNLDSRINAALNALTVSMLEKIETNYEPDTFRVKAKIAKTFTVEAPNEQDAKMQIVQSVNDNDGTVEEISAEAVND